MDEQTFFIRGNIYGANDEHLQAALAQIYDTPERPRCLCIKGGAAMYVAKHRAFVVKRMPETGSQHHPSCPSYASDSQQSGLGELMGEAVIEHSTEFVELRVDFPLTRVLGRSRPSGEQQSAADVSVPKRRMSLRAVMHFLFEKAGTSKYRKNGQSHLPLKSKHFLGIGCPSFKHNLRTKGKSNVHYFQF